MLQSSPPNTKYFSSYDIYDVYIIELYMFKMVFIN